MKEDLEFSKMMLKQIEEKLDEERAKYFIDNCIAYNVQWMESILEHNKINIRDDKTAVSQKIACYLHMIEAELRRSFDV